jgi:hypothetical protein
MSTENVLTEFRYAGFSPDETLQHEAQNTIDELMDLAPYDATLVAKMEKDGAVYRCSMDVFTLEGPFQAKGLHISPQGALQFVKDTVLRKLSKWRESRFTPPMQIKQPIKPWEQSSPSPAV